MSKAKNVVRSVGFFSFFKLTLLYGVAMGQLFGLAMLIFGLCGLPVHLNLIFWRVEGLTAGIGGLILSPLFFGFASLIVAPVLFLPFALACYVLGGFKVSHGN